jgi:N-acetylmuramoyl-L-alanine amidase
MRSIKLVVVHCSDSDIKAHDNIETIRGWHVKERGFSDVGYHYFISKDGKVHSGRPEETVGAHAVRHNSGSIGVCLSGRREFTAEQFGALEILLKDICFRYALGKQDIVAHNDLDPSKTCPNFDVHKLISSWEWH